MEISRLQQPYIKVVITLQGYSKLASNVETASWVRCYPMEQKAHAAP